MIPESELIPIAAILQEYNQNTLNSKKERINIQPARKEQSNIKITREKALNVKKAGKKTSKIKISAKSIGLIFPCHGLTIPIPVKRFLDMLDLTATEYIFAVATRGGTIFRGFSTINKALKKQGKKINSSFTITMESNDPKLKTFIVPSEEKMKEIELNISQKLDLICDMVINRKQYHDADDGINFTQNNFLNRILERLVTFSVHHIAPKVKKYFYINDNCSGCRICENICPSGKITMVNNKPIWNKKVQCYMCYGCLNYCPSEAIQIYSKWYMKSYTEENGRYHHPFAKIKEISTQKILKE